jgi:hypothetical protein
VATRSPEERKAAALAKLAGVDANVWIASASPVGAVHLVPMGHTWNGSQVVLAIGPRSRTVASVTANPQVRLALGDTRDVVTIDAVLAAGSSAKSLPDPPNFGTRAPRRRPGSSRLTAWKLPS